LQALAEDQSGSSWTSVVLDFFVSPALGLMKRNRSVVANVRNRLESSTTRRPRLFFETLVEHLAHTTTTVVGVNPDEVNVSCLGGSRSYEAEQEPHHDPVVFHDAGERSEFVKEDRMSECTRGPPPPAVDNLNNVL